MTELVSECALFVAGHLTPLFFSDPQLGIGFLLRERPVFALATVATVVVRMIPVPQIIISFFI